MKLTELAIDGYGNFRNLQLGKFSDGLNFIYGENGFGKTALRTFLRDVLFGFDRVSHSYLGGVKPSFGHLEVRQGADEFRVQRDTQINDNLRIQSITGSMIDQVGSLSQLTGNWNSDIYDTVFSFSFKSTQENARQLAHVLHSQLGIELGVRAAGDDVAYHNWKRESAERESRLISIKQRTESLAREKSDCQREIENLENTKRIRLADLDRQIQALSDRLSGVDLPHRQNELARIESEITKLRGLIEQAVETQVTYLPVSPVTEPHALLYQRLDEIDNQIRRWRRVQTDIQSQRVRLKDDMAVWNELTLESTDHPYHNAREILLAMENKVERAESVAHQWQDADVQRTDPAQMFASIKTLCDQMRNDLHGLCQELGHQYKHIRHKAVAAELKQLRRCYNEMGDNTQRLIRRRDDLITEIRRLDPAGAEAIEQSESDFYQCALHEGYLEARKKHVAAAFPHQSQQHVHRVVAPNLTQERHRLHSLELQRQDILKWIAAHEADFGNLRIQHAECVRQRESLLNNRESLQWNEKLASIDQELQTLNHEYQRLLPQLEEDRRYVKPTSNPILERAANLLVRISEGELTQVYLSDSYEVSDLQIRDRLGKILNFSALDKGQQDQTYLCLAIAASESLARNGIEAPIVIDDAFTNVVRDRVTQTLNLLMELGQAGHQIILLTQHRYLADRVPGAVVFEIPPSTTFPVPYSSPDRSPGLPEGPLPNTSYQPTPFVSNFDNDFTSMPVAGGFEYPLSKYRPLESESNYHEKINFIVPHPTVASHRADPNDIYSSEFASSNISPIPVDQVADPLGFAMPLDDESLLERTDVLDLGQLRALAKVEIETVGQLLAIEPDEMPIQLRESGISPDQFDRWQAQIWLLAVVPGMRVDDARVLVACGVTEPEHLATSRAQQLWERVQRFRSSPDGQRYINIIDSISINRINGWYRALDSTRSHWDRKEGFSRRSRRRRSQSARSESYRVRDNDSLRDSRDRTSSGRRERSSRQYTDRTPRKSRSRERDSRRDPIVARTPRMKTPNEKRAVPALAPVAVKTKSESTSVKEKSIGKQFRFFLDLEDHLEAAPSIGPKTAERFEKIDVHTVADFLKQTAESMSAKLNYKRISANVVRQWQQQARLVCRIPNLRGHDAQLLVACGFTEAESVATIQPKQLLEVIGPFSETKEGLKIIRNGKKPDLKEITDWISWAGHTRSLLAA